MRNSSSRWGGVAKLDFGTPMLHGKHKKKWFSWRVGRPIPVFSTPLQREGDFQHPKTYAFLLVLDLVL